MKTRNVYVIYLLSMIKDNYKSLIGVCLLFLVFAFILVDKIWFESVSVNAHVEGVYVEQTLFGNQKYVEIKVNNNPYLERVKIPLNEKVVIDDSIIVLEKRSVLTKRYSYDFITNKGHKLE